MKQRSHKKEVFLHVITAMLLLLKGYEKIEHHYFISGSIILFSALLIILLTFMHKQFKLPQASANVAAYVSESLALFITAYVSTDAGKNYIQYAFLLAGILYLVTAFRQYRTLKNLPVIH